MFVVYGPEDWDKVAKHCSESAQSPINIESSSAKKDSYLKGLSFSCDNKNGFVSGKISNNGHAPTLAIDKPKGTATLTGGPLGDSNFKLQQLHFHFGCEDNKGSEHTVDDKAYSGESMNFSWTLVIANKCPGVKAFYIRCSSKCSVK